MEEKEGTAMLILLGLGTVAGLGVLYSLLSYTWWWPRWPRGMPSFLMMHSVNDVPQDPEAPNNSVRPDLLVRLIRLLKRKGYQFQTFSEAVEHPALRSVAMTFDDGFADNYTQLFPILKAECVKATLFVTNRGVNDVRFLSPAQIVEMDRSGLVEIGGHTAHHTFLKHVTLSEAKMEIETNKSWLEQILGHPIASFCYPKGEENAEIVTLVKAAGYRCAAAMVKGMRLPQTDVWRVHRQIIPRGLSPRRCALLAICGKHKI